MNDDYIATLSNRIIFQGWLYYENIYVLFKQLLFNYPLINCLKVIYLTFGMQCFGT